MAGNFSFDTYYTNFTITAGSPLIGGTWGVGDEILAMGGKSVPNSGLIADTGWGTNGFTGNPVNSNLSTSGSTRIVSKFGTSPTAWTTSTIKPDAGNGLGSTSSGHGGDGAILIGSTDGEATVGNANTLLNATVQQRFPSPGFVGVNLTNMGKYIFLLDGTARMSSWETFLNLTDLKASLAPLAEVPQVGDRYNQALQRGMSTTLITDALIPTAPVPEPSSFILAAFAFIGLAGWAWRRRVC